MKKYIFALLLALAFAVAIPVTATERNSSLVTEEETVWITPTGVAIPSEYMNDWENYIATVGKKYNTQPCPTVNGVKKIKCLQGRPDDCSKAFDCTPCINCN